MTTRGAPLEAPPVSVTFGDALAYTLAAASFTREGDVFTARLPAPGLTLVVVDYAREVVAVTGTVHLACRASRPYVVGLSHDGLSWTRGLQSDGQGTV